MVASLTKIQLDKLVDIIKIPAGRAAMCMESCVWCLDQNDLHNGIELTLYFNNEIFKYPITWPEEEIDLAKINNFYNIDDAVEFGAEILSLFISLNHTDYDDLKRSIKTTGFDYWLCYKNSDLNLPFKNAGRLEISGILKENENNSISKRIKEKLKQTTQSDQTELPVVVVVVSFNQPCAKMVLQNVNGR